MSEDIEQARHGLEEAHHAHERGDPMARIVALLIAVLAAALALGEMVEKDAQTRYLVHEVAVSDNWNFYQAKNVRATVLGATVETLRSLPGAAGDAALQDRIRSLQQRQALLEDDPKGGQGRKQLQARAQHQEELRNEAAHRTHQMEWVVGLLQIAIVLASASVIARARPLAAGAAALGAAAALYGLLTAWQVI